MSDVDSGPGPRLYGLGTTVYAQRRGQILILKRAVGAASGAWYTPGGVLDPGETPEACAVRELREEAGLVPTGPLQLVGLIPVHVYQRDAFLVAYACDCEAGEVTLSEEHTASRWIDPVDYRDRFFSEENLRRVGAGNDRLGALARAVRRGLDEYLAWRARAGVVTARDGSRAAQVTRVFTGEDGESHFDDLEVPLHDRGPLGRISELRRATGIVFRETGADYALGFHNAPRRQFVINLEGWVELEVGDGSTRRLGPGDVLLAEDTTGRGHKSRAVDGGRRRCLFVTLD